MVTLTLDRFISGAKQSKMNRKILLLLFGMVFLGTLLISFAAAEFWACFEQGEVVHYCNDYRPSKTYTGSYPLCMSVYREAENCYIHGVWSKCNRLDPADCTQSGGGPTNFDLTPPELTILSPVNDTVYNSRRLYLAFSLDEEADVYYRDLNSASTSWRRICSGCDPGAISYNRSRSFMEGENSLIFKAVDVVNNEAYVSVNFLIDSMKPRIYRTEPRANYFAEGTFTAQFKEANPEKLTLHYGNATKNETADVDLDNDCHQESTKTVCDIEVNLNKYNGQTINYYFELEDIAGNSYSSRSTKVKVDTKAPVVNNPSSFFDVDGRYVIFNISIDEPNLYKVSLVREYGTRTITTTLCTRLTNGYCYKKQSLTRGDYEVSIQITDKAGHSIALPAEFTISY